MPSDETALPVSGPAAARGEAGPGLRQKPGGFIGNLQVLRFVAAVMVMASHVLNERLGPSGLAGDGIAPYTPFYWGAGVDIFFVISGFVMFYLSHDRFGRPGEPQRFLWRRAARLVPTYWLFTGLMVLATRVFREQLTYPDIAPGNLFASLAFLPWPDQKGEMFPPLIVGWTLNYEAMFYVLFAAALFLPKRWGMAALVALFAAGALMHAILPENWRMMRFWTDPIILEFLMGIALAVIYVRGCRLSPWAGLIGAGAGFALLAFLFHTGWQPPELRFLWAGIPALLICTGLALSDRQERHSRLYEAVVLCGSASYALYLSHLFTIKLVGVIWRKLAVGVPWAFILAASAAAVIASVLVYLLVEKPLVARLSDLPRKWARRAISEARK